MSKTKKTVLVLLVLAAVAAGAWFVWRCCAERGDSAAEPTDTVAKRMQDEAYLAKLVNQDQQRRLIMKGMVQARDAYRKAEAAGAPAEELAALKAEMKRCAEALEANRLQSQNIIRDKILADQNEADQLQKKGK